MSEFEKTSNHTGCEKCDEIQKRTGNLTALCDAHELEYLGWTATVSLKNYIDMVNEILRKEKE